MGVIRLSLAICEVATLPMAMTAFCTGRVLASEAEDALAMGSAMARPPRGGSNSQSHPVPCPLTNTHIRRDIFSTGREVLEGNTRQLVTEVELDEAVLQRSSRQGRIGVVSSCGDQDRQTSAAREEGRLDQHDDEMRVADGDGSVEVKVKGKWKGSSPGDEGPLDGHIRSLL